MIIEIGEYYILNETKIVKVEKDFGDGSEFLCSVGVFTPDRQIIYTGLDMIPTLIFTKNSISKPNRIQTKDFKNSVKQE